MIKFCVDIAGPTRPRALYAMRLLLEAEGIVATETPDPQGADLLYSRECPGNADQDLVWVRAADENWDASDLVVALRDGLAAVGSHADSGSVDLLLSAYYFSAGRWEKGATRNSFGVPVARDASLWDEGMLQRPALAAGAAALRDQLERVSERRNRELQAVERWPDGKRWVIALTHDVDRPLSKPPAAHYRKKLAKHAAGRELGALVRTTAGYIRNAIFTRDSGADPQADPQFGFAGWMRLAEELGIRSAFYVAVRGAGDQHGHPNDVFYDARMPAIRRALLGAVDRGFEVGLHASINCRIRPELFEEERSRLEEILHGQRVFGNRHHYWALDGVDPTQTLRAHGDAGFMYDSSLGLNDAPGFRRGVAWPFYPFDADASSEVGALQIPPTIMDAGAFYYEAGGDADRRAVLTRHLDAVAEARGCAVINWHLAQIVDERMNGAGPALRDELAARRRDDSDIWWATPRAIFDWWTARRERIFPATPR